MHNNRLFSPQYKNTHFSVEQVRKEHLDPLAVVAEECYRKTYPEYYTHERPYQDFIRNKTLDMNNPLFILKDSHHIVGFAELQIQNKHSISLEKIYILPSYQGKGGGKLLMEQCLQFALNRGIYAMQLKLVNDKLILFYKKFGFQLKNDFIPDSNYPKQKCMICPDVRINYQASQASVHSCCFL